MKRTILMACWLLVLAGASLLLPGPTGSALAGERIGDGGPLFTISSINGDIRIQKTD